MFLFVFLVEGFFYRDWVSVRVKSFSDYDYLFSKLKKWMNEDFSVFNCIMKFLFYRNEWVIIL